MPTKEIRITVSEEKHQELKEVKADRTWKEAIFDYFGVENE